jgi:hypothetical protein
MDKTWIATLCLILAGMLAACMGSPGPEPRATQEPADPAAPHAEFTSTTGAVAGSIVDAELRPLANATVSIGKAEPISQSMTDVQGRFAFSFLQAGTYTIRAHPDNVEPIEKTVEVRGGELTRVNILTNRIPGTEPFTDLVIRRGNVHCGATLKRTEFDYCSYAGVFTTSAGVEFQNPYLIFPVRGPHAGWNASMAEVVWTPQSAASSQLSVVYSPQCAIASIADGRGPSPMRLFINQSMLKKGFDEADKNPGVGDTACKSQGGPAGPDPQKKILRMCREEGVCNIVSSTRVWADSDVALVLDQTYQIYFSSAFFGTLRTDYTALPDA